MLDTQLIYQNKNLKDNLAVLWFSEFIVNNFKDEDLTFMEKDGEEFEQGLFDFMEAHIDDIQLQDFYSNKISKYSND